MEHARVELVVEAPARDRAAVLVDHDLSLAVVACDRDEGRDVLELLREQLLVREAVLPRQRHRDDRGRDGRGLDQEAVLALALLELVRER